MTELLTAVLSGTACDVLVVVAGGVVAVFGGGAVIARLLRPFAAQLVPSSESPTLANAGLYIGWLERALLYMFMLAGAASAAVAIVALKSVARFPSFRQERFAEYYLIGTLSSVFVATAAAMGVRALLDLDPLLAGG